MPMEIRGIIYLKPQEADSFAAVGQMLDVHGLMYMIPKHSAVHMDIFFWNPIRATMIAFRSRHAMHV